MSSRTVQNVVTYPGTSSPIPGRTISIQLNVPGFSNNGSTEILSTRVIQADDNGLWSVDLTPNSEIDPADTYYTVREIRGGTIWTFIVPAGSGATNLRDCLVVDPTNPNPLAAGAAIDLSNVDPATGRAALGLGTAATHPSTDFDAAGAASTAQAAAIAAAASDATTKVAAEAAARAAALTALVNGAPGALDTLNELATALGDDASFATTVTNALAAKAPLTSAALVTPTINGHTPVTADQAGSVFDAAGSIGLYAPPPTGVYATDTANLQPLVTQAQSTNGTLYLQTGIYVADLTTSRLSRQPKIVGKGEQLTQIDGTLTFAGQTGAFSGGYLSDLSFIGTHDAAFEIRGCTDVRWDRIGFYGTGGLLLNNYAIGDFTEMCRGQANFGTTVVTALEYRVVSGDGSFHGSGLTSGSTINQPNSPTAPSVLVGANAFPYNAPLDVAFWVRSTTQPLIRHNGLAATNFHGHLTFESFTGSTAIIVDHSSTAPLNFVGGVSLFGGSVGGFDQAFLALTTGISVNSPAYTPNAASAPLVATLTNVRSTQTTSGALIASLHNQCDATSGVLTMTLPSASPAGRPISVAKIDSSANKITVSGSISGATTTLDLLAQGDGVVLISNGGSWYPVSTNRTAAGLNAAITVETNRAQSAESTKLAVFNVDNYATPALAYAALVAAGGGRLVYTPGVTYQVTTTLTLDQSVPTEVVGYGATLVPAAGVTAISLQVARSGIPVVAVRGFTIDGSAHGGSSGTTVGVRVRDHYGAALQDLRILNCGTGVLITDSTGWSESSTLNNVYVSNCGVGVDIQTAGGTGSFGYAAWGLVHVDNVPSAGIGVRWGAGTNFYNSSIETLIIHTSAASCTGLSVAGDIGLNVQIHAVLEGFSTASGRIAIDLASTAVLDGAKITAYIAGTWTTSINNGSGIQYQMRVPRTTEIGQASTSILAKSSLVNDANPRWQRTVDGGQSFGPGSTAFDVTLGRSAVGTIQSSGALSVAGLTGAVAPVRWVGGEASGAPASGSYLVGDFVIDQTGSVWICTSSGTPGTWKSTPKALPAAVKSGYYYYASSPGGNGTGAQPINTPRVSSLLLQQPTSIARLAIEFTAAGSADSVFRVGVWADDGSGFPAALLLDAGTISTGTGNAGGVATGGTPGVYEITLGSALVLQPGLYWVGGASQGTSAATMRTVLPYNVAALQMPVATLLPGTNGSLGGYAGSTATGAFGAFGTVTAVATIARLIYKTS